MKAVSNRGGSAKKQQKKKATPRKSVSKPIGRRKAPRSHPKYGTSKLEDDFARDFLDKLGVRYTRQFEAKDIGRFYDFAVMVGDDGESGNILLIEIDGGYYHSDPRVVSEDKMNPMQKHNKYVDGLKDKWALMHGIPIMRIWEKDIREGASKVMKSLKERLYVEHDKAVKDGEKRKRHRNRINK